MQYQSLSVPEIGRLLKIYIKLLQNRKKNLEVKKWKKKDISGNTAFGFIFFTVKHYWLFLQMNYMELPLNYTVLKIIWNTCLEIEKKKKYFWGGTRIWTMDLSICSRLLYHWAIPPGWRMLARQTCIQLQCIAMCAHMCVVHFCRSL